MRGLIVIGVALVLASAACGEAGVQYQGYVIEDEKEAARWFDSVAAVGTPVRGAIVDLCLDGGCGTDLVYTDENGYYITPQVIFGGTLWSETRVEVHVTAPDGRQAGYVAIYEDTSDPTDIYELCDDVPERCPPVFLNFQLGP